MDLNTVFQAVNMKKGHDFNKLVTFQTQPQDASPPVGAQCDAGLQQEQRLFLNKYSQSPA